MHYTQLTYQIESRVAHVKMNRPEKRNSFNAELIFELNAVIREATSDETVRVIVLSGEGKSFSAGMDLDYLLTIAKNSPIENAEDSKRFMEMLYAWKTSSKPTIAMVSGHALAGGCGLALTCDIVIASDEAKFGFTEVRIGFVPAIVSRLLIDRIGKGKAIELVLRGNIITAHDAKEIGMINEVVEANNLQSNVESIAQEIVQTTSPQAMRLTKKLLNDIEGMDLQTAMHYATKINAFSRTTDDFKRGVQSFIDKKKISWT